MCVKIIPSKLLKISGAFHRFGKYGSVYEVVDLAGINETGEKMRHIRLLEDGKEFNYELSNILNDPMG